MTAKDKLFQKIDLAIGKARATYYITPLSEYMISRGKSALASLASNPLVQLLQSMWMSSGTGAMTGGGGTTGKSALGQALVGSGPIPPDWTEANRWSILMDVLLFRAFPSAVSFVAHMGLSALNDTQVKAEAKRRWGAKVATAFLAWHKATVVFLSAISEFDEKSPAKRKRASVLPNLAELTGHSNKRKPTAKRINTRREAPPNDELLAKAEALRKEQAKGG